MTLDDTGISHVWYRRRNHRGAPILSDMAQDIHDVAVSDDGKWLWNGSEWIPTPPEVTENRNEASGKNETQVEYNALRTMYNSAISTISITFILFSLTLIPGNLAFQEYFVEPCKGSEDEICNGIRQVQFLFISQFLIFFIGGLAIHWRYMPARIYPTKLDSNSRRGDSQDDSLFMRAMAGNLGILMIVVMFVLILIGVS